MTMGTAQDPLRGMTADAMAITPAVFDSQIEECIPQVGCRVVGGFCVCIWCGFMGIWLMKL